MTCCRATNSKKLFGSVGAKRDAYHFGRQIGCARIWHLLHHRFAVDKWGAEIEINKSKKNKDEDDGGGAAPKGFFDERKRLALQSLQHGTEITAEQVMEFKTFLKAVC